MKNYKIQTLSPLAHTPMLLTSDFPLKGGEPVCGRKSPFKGDLEGLHLPYGSSSSIFLNFWMFSSSVDLR